MCKNIHGVAFQKPTYKSAYINEFRLTYFRQILIKAYNNSNAVKEIIGSDHSGFTEPILTGDDYTFIDSLVSIDNERIKMDSADGNRRAEGAQGKRPLGFILNRIRSKWLDSLANERYRRSGIKESFSY